MPGPFTAIDRRRLLTGGGALALLVLATSACSPVPAPPAVDELVSQLQLARHDSELATAAAGVAAPPALARALAQVATERAEHARALATEIARAAGEPEPSPAEPATATSTTEPPAPTVSDVVNAVRAAADSAGKLAITSSGYRAGLLASIAAACTAAYTVALAAQP